MAIKIYADGADIKNIIELNKNPLIEGFTSNPTLMKKSGITNYEKFAKEVLKYVKEKPFSFEVFSDNWNEMYREAKIISSWGDNVFVKIPITNTQGVSSEKLIEELSQQNVKINVTAITTIPQVVVASCALKNYTNSIISVFAGRIADTMVSPIPTMYLARNIIKQYSNQKLLWASSREVLNLKEAEDCGCDIITMTNDLIKKLS
jgi:transaldolase